MVALNYTETSEKSLRPRNRQSAPMNFDNIGSQCHLLWQKASLATGVLETLTPLRGWDLKRGAISNTVQPALRSLRAIQFSDVDK
jgi:hypothetical protein